MTIGQTVSLCLASFSLGMLTNYLLYILICWRDK